MAGNRRLYFVLGAKKGDCPKRSAFPGAETGLSLFSAITCVVSPAERVKSKLIYGLSLLRPVRVVCILS